MTDRCRTHPPSCPTGAVQRFALPRGRSLAPVRRAGRAGCRPDRPQDRLFANSSLAPAASGRCSTSGCPVVTASSDRHSATRRSGRRDTPRATPDSSGLTLPADREPTEAVRRPDHTRTDVRAEAAQVAALASEHTLGTHGGVVGRRLRPSAMTATSPARNSDHASSSARRLSRKVDREAPFDSRADRMRQTRFHHRVIRVRALRCPRAERRAPAVRRPRAGETGRPHDPGHGRRRQRAGPRLRTREDQRVVAVVPAQRPPRPDRPRSAPPRAHAGRGRRAPSAASGRCPAATSTPVRGPAALPACRPGRPAGRAARPRAAPASPPAPCVRPATAAPGSSRRPCRRSSAASASSSAAPPRTGRRPA